MVINDGELDFEGANSANIPVDIWLNMDEDKEEYPGKFVLTAGNYMPRKGRVEDAAYKAVCDTKEEAQELINKYILPFYIKAIEKIKDMAEKGEGSLYYWD
jgi:hypothetical protein